MSEKYSLQQLTNYCTAAGTKGRSQVIGKELHSGESTAIALNDPFPVVRSANIHALWFSVRNRTIKCHQFNILLGVPVLFLLFTSLKTSTKCVDRNKISFEAQGHGTRLRERGMPSSRTWQRKERFLRQKINAFNQVFCSFQLVIRRFISLSIIIYNISSCQPKMLLKCAVLLTTGNGTTHLNKPTKKLTPSKITILRTSASILNRAKNQNYAFEWQQFLEQHDLTSKFIFTQSTIQSTIQHIPLRQIKHRLRCCKTKET